MDVIELNPNTTTFKANGTTYHVERDARLSIARDRWLEKFSLYALLGRDAMQFLSEVKRAAASNNASKPGDTGVILDNLLKGAADLATKIGPLYYVATIFINREGEDRRTFDLAIAEQKISDWEAAGIDRDFFLSVALSYLTTTAERWQKLIQTYSNLDLPGLMMQSPSPSENDS